MIYYLQHYLLETVTTMIINVLYMKGYMYQTEVIL